MYNNTKRLFSLVELMVIFAIFAVLASLLQPSLKKMMAAAETTSCLANERSISAASFLYSEDNAGFIVPSGFYNTVTLIHEYAPWDRNLAIYMNREHITKMQKGNNPDNDVLRCPSDLIPGAGGWERRSYAMNGRRDLVPDHDKWGPASGRPHYITFKVIKNCL